MPVFIRLQSGGRRLACGLVRGMGWGIACGIACHAIWGGSWTAAAWQGGKRQDMSGEFLDAVAAPPVVRLEGAFGRDAELYQHFVGEQWIANAWGYYMVAPPDWGAWAEQYQAEGVVVGAVLYLTQNPAGSYTGQTLDLFLYASDGDNPTEVISVTPGLTLPEPPALWPEMTPYLFEIGDVAVPSPFFVGFWGNWPDAYPGFYVAGDYVPEDPPPGWPRTHIRPGHEWPGGWHHPYIVHGPFLRNLAIGVYFEQEPTPAESRTWGAIRGLYR